MVPKQEGTDKVTVPLIARTLRERWESTRLAPDTPLLFFPTTYGRERKTAPKQKPTSPTSSPKPSPFLESKKNKSKMAVHYAPLFRQKKRPKPPSYSPYPTLPRPFNTILCFQT